MPASFPAGGNTKARVSRLFEKKVLTDPTDIKWASEAFNFLQSPRYELKTIVEHLMNIGQIEMFMEPEDVPPWVDTMHRQPLELLCRHHFSAAKASSLLASGSKNREKSLHLALDAAKTLKKGYADTALLEEIQIFCKQNAIVLDTTKTPQLL